jgi:hypothetical protein
VSAYCFHGFVGASGKPEAAKNGARAGEKKVAAASSYPIYPILNELGRKAGGSVGLTPVFPQRFFMQRL